MAREVVKGVESLHYRNPRFPDITLCGRAFYESNGDLPRLPFCRVCHYKSMKKRPPPKRDVPLGDD